MEARHILSFLTILLFCVYFFKSRYTKRSYILFVLYFFPFIDLTVTSEAIGSFTVFDAITYCSLFFLIQDFAFSAKYIKIYFLLFWVFLLILLIGSVQSEFVLNSLINMLKLIPIFIYANLLIAEYYENPLFAASVVRGLKFACISSVIFLVIQLFAGFKFTFYPYLNQNILDSTVARYPSFFQDPQMYSQFLAMSSFLFLIKADDSTPKVQYINYCFFVVIVFCIFLSGGRSGFLGLCVGTLIVLIAGKNKFRFFIVACSLVGYLSILYLPGIFSMFNRQEGYDEAYEVRRQIWKEAYNVFIYNPVLGIGTGNYGKYVELHSLSGYYVVDGEIVYYGTESGYLKILVETGILGFITSFAFIFLPVIRALMAYIKKINNYNIFYLIAGLFSWMTAFNTLYTLSDRRTLVVVASLVCLLIASGKRIKSIDEQ